MVHKKAYYRGLCKIAIALLKTTYGAQVGRGTRTNTLPTTDVVVNGKAQTYGDFGFQDTGLHHVNWAGLDKRKAEAVKQGKQYDPSFIEFITDKTIAGQHYIPRESIDRMSHEMARIRGGQTPLSKRNVDHSDMLKYLNEAYKHDRDKYYEGNGNYLDSAIAAYETYLQDPKNNATAYKEQGNYQPKESGTLPTPARILLPTTPVADKLDPPQKTAAPLISPELQKKVFGSSYAKRFFTAYNMLMNNEDLRKAYVEGRKSYGSSMDSTLVGSRFTDAGYYTNNSILDPYSRQKAYQEDWKNVRDTLGVNDIWMYNNRDTVYDLYSKYNQNRSN